MFYLVRFNKQNSDFLRQHYGHCSIRDSKFRCNIVSLTALNTTLIFSVSTAVVKWWNSGFRGSLFTALKKSSKKACTSKRLLSSPVNSGKYQRIFVSPDFNFSANKSVLFKNKIIETPLKTKLLTIVSNMFFDSSSLFVFLKHRTETHLAIN